MKLMQAIADADTMQPNVFPPEQKAEWIHRIDITLCSIMGEYTPMNTYPDDTELTCPEEFSDLYALYCASMISFHNAEWDNYNNISAMFESRLKEFKTYWIQNNPSKNSGGFKF